MTSEKLKTTGSDAGAGTHRSSVHDHRFTLGIRVNFNQFALQLAQVFLVGLTLGMTRTVVPAVAESEFGLPARATGLLVAFVIAFGVVKGVMNFVAGAISERLGRKKVLVLGWIIALPIPFMIGFGPDWSWIVAATVLLGINQGLTWSMALTSKLDLTRPDQRGLTNGLNEFFGYFAVAVAGIVTGYMSDSFGARVGLLIFGLAAIVPALAIALLLVRDTRPWISNAEDTEERLGLGTDAMKSNALREELANRDVVNLPAVSSVSSVFQSQKTWQSVIALTLRDRRFFALCQAGLIEKFVDALVWIFFPIFLTTRGVELAQIGWIPGIYASVWGVAQLVTGPFSDRVGRKPPIVIGMFMCAAGVALMVMRDGLMWWGSCAGITGLGMALLYPTLGASIADLAHPTWRGVALGAYRFWRDLGYAIGALGLGLAAHFTSALEAGFQLVAIAMAISAVMMLALGSETHRRRPPPTG
jgi:MFS family permease